MKIIILGSNPSNASPYNFAFTHCKSGEILDEWLDVLNLNRNSIELMNVSDIKTPNNRPLTRREIIDGIPKIKDVIKGNIVITLGKTASSAVDILSKRYVESSPKVKIELPHPSPRNRKNNDKEWLRRTLIEARGIIETLKNNDHGGVI